VTVAAPSPRSEPLLWLQLLGLGVMPLEALLVMLLLAGSDPGPLPQLERLLCWAIGSVAPAFLLWKRPADVWSLLLVQAPLRGRREPQQRLSSLQGTPLLRAGLLVGCGLSLALLWWIDRHAALASAFSPLEGGARLVALLLTAAVLALLLWQWQQLLQALWLLSRSPAQLAAATPMGQAAVAEQRLSLGIPLLLLNPLQPEASVPSPVRSTSSPASANVAGAQTVIDRPPQGALAKPNEEVKPFADEPRDPEPPLVEAEILDPPSGGGAAVAVEPEQGSTGQQGTNLDQPIG